MSDYRVFNLNLLKQCFQTIKIILFLFQMQRWQIFSRYAESNGLGVEDAYAVKGSQPKKRKTISCSKAISGT